eukprot:5635200-Pleurochrysis_carterae.AAC.2
MNGRGQSSTSSQYATSNDDTSMALTVSCSRCESFGRTLADLDNEILEWMAYYGLWTMHLRILDLLFKFSIPGLQESLCSLLLQQMSSEARSMISQDTGKHSTHTLTLLGDMKVNLRCRNYTNLNSSHTSEVTCLLSATSAMTNWKLNASISHMEVSATNSWISVV